MTCYEKGGGNMSITERKAYPWLLVVFYSLLGIFCPAAVTQFSMVVNDLAEALSVESDVILLTDTARAVCLVCSMFLSGYIYKKLGLRKTIALGLAFQTLPQFLIPLAINMNSVPLLFIFKGMQGLNAMAFPLYISTITMWMDEKYVALSTAIFNGSFVAGSGVGAWIAGKVVPMFGVEASFYIIGVICLVFAIPVILITRDKPKENVVTEENAKKNVYGSIVKQTVTWLLVIALIANTWVNQSVTVDMSVYASSLGLGYGETGDLMLVISIVTVIASILAGAVSDHFAQKAKNKVRTRSIIMGLGYVSSVVSSALLPFVAPSGFTALAICACLMMFGSSWAAGVFWALPVELYSEEDNVAGTAFCSGASNIPNPIAPMVVGVWLGSSGNWTAGWLTCAITSLLSMLASFALATKKSSREIKIQK